MIPRFVARAAWAIRLRIMRAQLPPEALAIAREIKRRQKHHKSTSGLRKEFAIRMFAKDSSNDG